MFVNDVRALIEEQRTTRYVAIVLEELEVQLVDHVPLEFQQYFIGRCRALLEEEL